MALFCSISNFDFNKYTFYNHCKQTITPIALNLNANVESTLKMLRLLMGEDIDLALPDR
ncbi:MAG: hypothetical protein HOG03_10455 [Desulfobacula sp.]|uniref:hypothetical protein n=1 Tax=Desulfobacula sp. TaxID=2593537 RepID=UPI001D649D5C|nr:hypothetical protein [Desulfobacula sp.]MBT4024090.1 hypothetical protein [Desulfobacula sp.]MBT4505685.1 hypothetical protein [Desulfobacula sp.]MBT4876656.1 hypothetical protein [Desulfobacula sp.]MBT5543735.1 hypothetical protein [Desulfobacula sp.]